jgi:hypothetical protein
MSAHRRDAKGGRTLAGHLAASAIAITGCTSNPYVIGAIASTSVEGGAGVDAANQGVSFAADFDRSGVSLLGDELALPSSSLGVSFRLRGESATMAGWPADPGVALSRGSGLARLQLEAPFTDTTRAVGLARDAPIYIAGSADVGAVESDDFVLEIVLRTEPSSAIADHRGGARGWGLSTGADGSLSLNLDDGTGHLLASEPLVAGAWYHCLFWVARSTGGQTFCNARPGAVVDLRSLGSLVSTAPLAIGGASNGPRNEIAELALFRAAPGRLDGADASAISRTRFAIVTGARPRVAKGSAFAAAGLRDSPAYVDLLREGSAVRQLFLVGPDWPRIACRADLAGTRDCGYLSEPKRTRWAEPKPDAWSADGLAVQADASLLADGESNLSSLIPSAAVAPHALVWSGTYGPARQSLSFFARAASGRLIAATVSNLGSAIFDLKDGKVVSSPAGALATLEPWGDGLFRCAVAFDAGQGAQTYRIELMADPSGTAFAGDGASSWVAVSGLQLDVGQSNAGSLLAGAEQAADHLTFVANDGNLPTGESASVGLRLLLPPGPRLTDQAVINLNQGGSFEDQVQVFVRGSPGSSDSGKLQFWGLRGGKTYWTFFHPTSAVDGVRHSVRASWTATTALMQVDGVSSESPALPGAAPFALDRIDVGFSAKSSGALEGLLAGLSIGEP